MNSNSSYQIASLEVTNNWLNLTWANEHLSQYPGVWLRSKYWSEQAGEILMFNNQRLMHGRPAFDPPSRRHVHTRHVDLVEFCSRLHVGFRDRDDPRRWMTFRKN